MSSPTVKFVLVAIAANATKDGVVRTSAARIVDLTSLELITVYRSIQELQNTGWLTVQAGSNSGSDFVPASDQYLTQLINEAGEGKLMRTQVVPNEPWFFCIRKTPREMRLRSASL